MSAKKLRRLIILCLREPMVVKSTTGHQLARIAKVAARFAKVEVDKRDGASQYAGNSAA
jgi:hypothetical protein